jgi:hypothetical protein
MPLPLLAIAAKLLPFASVVPDVIRAFGGGKSADAAEKMVGIAKALTGDSDGEAAASKIIADPALQLQYQQMLSSERLKFQQMEYEDRQHAHEQQQETIRTGDTSEDDYVRHTRPLMARQSWYATVSYIIGFEAAKALGFAQVGANFELSMIMLAPAAAYLGFRTGDKFADAWKERSGKKK